MVLNQYNLFFRLLEKKKYNNIIIDEFINSIGILSQDIDELQNIGLINYFSAGYVYKNHELVINYYGDKLLLKSCKDSYIDLGSYQYTKCGAELAKILYKDLVYEKDTKYIDFLAEFLVVEKGNHVQKI